MNTTLNTTFTEQIPASIEAAESKLAAIVDQAVFFLKTAVILSATVLLLASAWI